MRRWSKHPCGCSAATRHLRRRGEQGHPQPELGELEGSEPGLHPLERPRYSSRFHGQAMPELFRSQLSSVGMTIKNESSVEIDMLDSDDFYSYHAA